VPFTRRSAGQGLKSDRQPSGAVDALTKTRFAFAALLICGLAIGRAPSCGRDAVPIEIEPARLVMDAGFRPRPDLPRPNRRRPPRPTAAPRAHTSATPAPGRRADRQRRTLTGIATVIRNKDSIALKLQDDIYLNDALLTSANSRSASLSTTPPPSISPPTRRSWWTVLSMRNAIRCALFDIVKGTVAFAAAAVAKTADHENFDARPRRWAFAAPPASSKCRRRERRKLPTMSRSSSIPTPTRKVGRIEVNDHSGAAGVSHPGRQRLHHPARRRRAVRRGRPGDLAQQAQRRPGHRAQVTPRRPSAARS